MSSAATTLHDGRFSLDTREDTTRAGVKKANIDRSERVKALKRLVEYGKEKIRKSNATN